MKKIKASKIRTMQLRFYSCLVSGYHYSASCVLLNVHHYLWFTQMLAKKVETLTKAMEVEAKKMRREVAAMEKEVAAMRVEKEHENRAKRFSHSKSTVSAAQILPSRYRLHSTFSPPLQL